VLNQLGIICSYDKSLRAMHNFGLSQQQEMQEKVTGGTPFMLCWDNLVLTEKKEEETLHNRRMLLSMKSGYVQFLHIPPPPPSAENRNNPDHWMLAAYSNIMGTIQNNGTRGIGLPECPLEVAEPRYHAVDPFDLLFVGSIQKHQPLIARGHAARILQRFCGTSLDVYKAPGGTRPVLPALPDGPEYYTIAEVKSSLYVLRIFDVDETTLDGTSRLVDLLMEDLNFAAKDLNDHQVDMVGDHARVRSLQQLRVRDYSEHRMAFAGIKQQPIVPSNDELDSSNCEENGSDEHEGQEGYELEEEYSDND